MLKRYIVIFSVILLITAAGCGKKGDPMPKVLPSPAGINDLSGAVKDGVLFLSFSSPALKADTAETKDIAGFKVLKTCGSCIAGTFEPFKDIRLDERKGYALYDNRIYVYDEDLTGGLQYSYKIHPYTKRGTVGDASNVFSIKWETPPDQPRNVSAKEDDGRAELSWSREEGLLYNVYRYENGVYPLLPLNKIPLSVTLYVDSGLENGKRYRYAVRKVRVKGGVQWEGEGVVLDVVPKDKTPPTVPLDMKAEWKGNTVVINWREPPDKDLAGYNVYRIGAGTAKKLNTELTRDALYIDAAVPDLRYVSYFVTSVDTSGNESGQSRELIVILRE
ncbi:MAG TPA: fibronectin type III domain-containing protein [Syntrophorhabdaceae bacterium]|nr:fibronectin type III domain-containing protein [Syntrophorhabdaceae bacterium]HQM80886.1 fibronectin type III domain-containing protein [Syntrophorhabdaceae bacterium]